MPADGASPVDRARPQGSELADLISFAGLPSASSVLVLGAGASDLVPALREAGHRAIGVGTPAAGVAGDVRRMPVRSGSVDAALCRDLVTREADPEAILAELVRAVKPGGVLVLEEQVARGADGRRAIEALCAHLAGEYLGIEAFRWAEPDRVARWILRVPPGSKPPSAGDR